MLESFNDNSEKYSNFKSQEEMDEVHTEGIGKTLPITLDSVHFTGGTLTLFAYGQVWRKLLSPNIPIVNPHQRRLSH
uniref:Uncharacterized protein n=1 Tax=Nelumbo nucifera TaxID=4432 RepID=A0A822ZN23_NELNU|nr:TPA_asm: hypothetical protein HUJ06_001418 [Nelumbo nucifera]